MSYDKLWICPSIERSTWRERNQTKHEFSLGESQPEFDRLHKKGNFVVLVHGAEYCIEELFVFVRLKDAIEFYESTYRTRAYERPDGSFVGFQEVSLYLNGDRQASKEEGPVVTCWFSSRAVIRGAEPVVHHREACGEKV